MNLQHCKTVRLYLLLSAGFICLFLASLVLGRFRISFHELAAVLSSALTAGETENTAYTVFFSSRLPRVTAAALIGCGLSVSGAAYQGIFHSPMISPDILGASAGAGFGAALGFLLGLPQMITQGMAFVCGLLAVACVLLLAGLVGTGNRGSRLLLVLCGLVVGAMFQAFISMVKYAADPFDTMPSIAFWLMGGLTYVTSSEVLFLLIPTAAGTAVLMAMRWRINVLSLNEEETASLGVNVARCRGLIIVCATLITAACVAVGGLIGWVGLVVPHFARLLVGPDYRKMLPCTALMGAGYLLFVDDIARCLFQELPIGILTAIVGAPVFILLLAREKDRVL